MDSCVAPNTHALQVITRFVRALRSRATYLCLSGQSVVRFTGGEGDHDFFEVRISLGAGPKNGNPIPPTRALLLARSPTRDPIAILLLRSAGELRN